MNIYEPFNGEEINPDLWEIGSKSGRAVTIENGRLKFSGGNNWCGAYIQTKEGIRKDVDCVIEFDYEIAGAHYRSADKPYVAIGAKNSKRESSYMMREEKSFFLFLGDNFDTNVRSKFYLATSRETSNPSLICDEISVNYPVGTKLKIKMEINSNKVANVYIDGELRMSSVIPNWEDFGDEYYLEINSNTYRNSFDEYYDNISISQVLKYSLLKIDEKTFSFSNGGMVQILPKEVELTDEIFREKGVVNIRDLNKEVFQGQASMMEIEELAEGKVFGVNVIEKYYSMIEIESAEDSGVKFLVKNKFNEIFRVFSEEVDVVGEKTTAWKTERIATGDISKEMMDSYGESKITLTRELLDQIGDSSVISINENQIESVSVKGQYKNKLIHFFRGGKILTYLDEEVDTATAQFNHEPIRMLDRIKDKNSKICFLKKDGLDVKLKCRVKEPFRPIDKLGDNFKLLKFTPDN